MAHTTKLRTGNHAHHDGDFGADITFVIDGVGHVIPTSDVLEMAAEKIRSERISSLEIMDAEQLLGLSS